MLAVISPAKKLDFETSTRVSKHSVPNFLGEAENLILDLRKRNVNELQTLMSISIKLAELNRDRYAEWTPDTPTEKSRQALLAFMGDVYVGLDARSLSPRELNYAQSHLRILSGLYGILRPLDLIQPHRLEMGTKLPNTQGSNLYKFWGDKLSSTLCAQAASVRTKYLVNLASNEYFNAIDNVGLKLNVITPVFKDRTKGEFKVVSFFAKKARGMMARYILNTRPKKPEDLKQFDAEGYLFNAEMSSTSELIFTRDKR
jgi:cytoplasmic iron level regulating protein YaaA (DUF328/UPF0246 family)